MYAGQVLRCQLVLVSGEHDAEQLGVGQTHAEVQHEMVISHFQDLDHPAEETVHVVHS